MSPTLNKQDESELQVIEAQIDALIVMKAARNREVERITRQIRLYTEQLQKLGKRRSELATFRLDY